MKVAVLGDTHIKRTGTRPLPETVYRIVERADLILHTGDIVVAEVLEDLARFAPVIAVLGNNDHELVGTLPETRRVDAGGAQIGMIHDSGPAPGRERRMRRAFDGCSLVVFGHSHIPLIALGQDGQLLLNPGSPTDKRRQPGFTMATFGVKDGRPVRPRLHVL